MLVLQPNTNCIQDKLATKIVKRHSGFKMIATLLPDFAVYFLSYERLEEREQIEERNFHHHQHLQRSTQIEVSLVGMYECVP